jgi:putative heme-binding domain-containing protein
MKGFVYATLFTFGVLVLYLSIAYIITDLSGGGGRGSGPTEGRSVEVGEAVFWGKGKCHTCHSLGDQGSAVRAPNLGVSSDFDLPIATRATERAKELSEKIGKPMTATDYLIQSHLDPSAYVVDGFKDEMPTVWKPPIALNLDEIVSVDLYMQSQGGEPSEEVLKASPLYAELQKKTATAAEATTVAFKPYLEGDPEKGQQMFFDLKGKVACAKCHAVGEEGGDIGPELTTVSGTRDLPYIIESILQPSAVIVSGYEPYLVITIDEDYLTGIKKEETEDSITLLMDDGELLEIYQDEIEELVPQETSIMPANFREILTVDELHHLIAYLQTLQ